MHVISRRPFNDAKRKFPNDAVTIDATYEVLKNGTFKTSESLKQVFSSLDNFKHADKWWVIDIGCNNLRLLAFIEFRHNRMYVKHNVTHKEYDALTKKHRGK
jgi:mRNA interferase HigB